MLYKLNVLQYIFILSLICGTIIKKDNLSSQNIKKYDTIYKIMSDHYDMSKFVKSVIKECNINHYHILNSYIYKKNTFIFKEMEYIYFFRSKNLLVYFFKRKNENEHKVYFEGVNDMGDLQYLSFPNKWFNEYTLKSIRKNLSENGFLFQIIENKVLRIQNKIHSIFSSFSYLNHHLYQKNNSQNILIEGYSMGGVLSQVFTYILLQEKYIQKYNLKVLLYIIESWWGGSKEFYEYLSSYITIKNVMCVGSILYYYNLFFQNYFHIDKYVQFQVKPLFMKYIRLPFPMGITEYFGDHHYISRFLKYIK